ncbi:MAG: flagellar basal body P-ring formation chaperone FlgA [Acidobacteriia bacterium]|nr:flagellar basal body P-ring formation chaperone FlgA [Terriglobia bacterium]
MIFLETIMALPFLLAVVPNVVPPVVGQPDGCLPIQDDRIYARDVVAAVPAFANVAADFTLGYAPAPGTRRVFKGDSLEKLARNQGVAAEMLEAVPDVCFERATATLEAGEILEAMRSSWGTGSVPSPDVRMELKSFSPQIAPQGKIVFPRSGLQLPTTSDPQAEVVWRGYVLYGTNRRFGITARARITTTTTRVVAVADLSTGVPVREDQVRLESFDTFALDDRPARNLDEVVGFVPRTLIRSGVTVLRSQLSRAPEVARGDMVKVEVTAGGAHLLFEGRAETDGVEGKTILVKNLTSGKDFRARVTGKGKVSVQ